MEGTGQRHVMHIADWLKYDTISQVSQLQSTVTSPSEMGSLGFGSEAPTEAPEFKIMLT